MNPKELHKQLVERYIKGEASTGEVEVFFHLLNEGQLDEYLDRATLEGADPLLQPESQFDEPGKRPGRLMKMRRYSVAAAVILLVGLGIFLWLRSGRKQAERLAVNVFKNEVSPGGNKALLTLADGSTVVLDSAQKGQLTNQGNARVIKVGAGQLSYKAVQNNGSAAQNGAAVYYNTISVPSGVTFQVDLADGTKVWLNALSTLRFPTAFYDTARVVELTGEAYFEVAPLTAKGGQGRVPFKVNVAPSGSAGSGMQVQVLGTRFNVNAYGDESAVKTTLLEGSVKLVKGDRAIQLRPGEQGQSPDPASGEAPFILVKGADVEQTVAWKNGHFSFEGADIYTVMRQISRWYGVQVRYEGNPAPALFGGEIERGLNLTQLLTGLSKSGVHFRLEGKMLTVLR
jgi:transmembrane sensor